MAARLLGFLAMAWAVDAALLVTQATAVGLALARVVDGVPVQDTFTPVVVFLVGGAARMALSALRDAAAATVGARTRGRLRSDGFAHALRCGTAAGHTGDLSTTLGHGLDAVAPWFSGFLPALVGAAVAPAMLIVWMLAVDVPSGVAVALTVPLIPVFMVLIGLRAEAWAGSQWATLERLSGHVVELLRGLPTLWLLRREPSQEQAMATLGAHLRRTTVAGLRVAFLSAFVLELVAMLGTAIVAVTIGLRLVTDSLDLATGFAVLILTPEVYARLRDVGVRYHASREGSLAVAGVLDLLDTVPDPTVGGTRPAPARAVIRVRRGEVVAADREPALVDADLDVEPARLTVLVGASGSGKTTLARVVAGLQRLDRGSVTVAGVDLADIDADTWRRQVAWVPAWPVVMTGTVRDNLLIGSAEAISYEHLWAVLTEVAADEWVRSLPEGLDTAIGPSHRDVSGGERARLGLARALLRSPRLLVADEPLAHLDLATAAVVEATLRGLVDTGTTVLVVSHDLGVALRADRVALLVDGRVVESGDPARLATQPSLFAAHLSAAEVAA